MLFGKMVYQFEKNSSFYRLVKEKKNNKTKIYYLAHILCGAMLFLFLFTIGCVEHNKKEKEFHLFRNVKVNMFKNDTFQLGLEENLTNAVIKELLSNGRVKVVDKEADAEIELSGIIKKYTRQALSTDRSGLVELYQIGLECEISLENLKNKEEAIKKITVNAFTTYVPKRGHIEYETESEAQTRLIEDLANEIVYKILERK